jgi:hypothetical protein
VEPDVLVLASERRLVTLAATHRTEFGSAAVATALRAARTLAGAVGKHRGDCLAAQEFEFNSEPAAKAPHRSPTKLEYCTKLFL